MLQKNFAEKAVSILQNDESVVGLAAGGSWLTNELDQYSDLDLVLVTTEKVSGNLMAMLSYARRLGQLLSAFTGEHVGEPRLLICLYDDPLLHVDIKFLMPDEFSLRVETPVILLDKQNILRQLIDQSKPVFPYPDYQWIEDRFWIWIHYALLKIGRGEYLEALDFMGFLRMVVFGPLLHIKQGNLPRGVRKAEMQLPEQDLKDLLATVPSYSKSALLESLRHAMALYTQLRASLYPPGICLQKTTETRVRQYLHTIETSTEVNQLYNG